LAYTQIQQYSSAQISHPPELTCCGFRVQISAVKKMEPWSSVPTYCLHTLIVGVGTSQRIYCFVVMGHRAKRYQRIKLEVVGVAENLGSNGSALYTGAPSYGRLMNVIIQPCRNQFYNCKWNG